jgi:hypothetical protein
MRGGLRLLLLRVLWLLRGRRHRRGRRRLLSLLRCGLLKGLLRCLLRRRTGRRRRIDHARLGRNSRALGLIGLRAAARCLREQARDGCGGNETRDDYGARSGRYERMDTAFLRGLTGWVVHSGLRL